MPHKLKQPPAQESGWAVSDLQVPFSSLDQETLCLLHVLMRLKQRKSMCCTFNKNTVQSSIAFSSITGMENVMYKSLILAYETCYVASAAEQIQELV